MGSLGGGSKQKTSNTSTSTSTSAPLTPAQVQEYYTQLNANSGGRLADYAMNGTPATPYTPLGPAGQVTATQASFTPVDWSKQLTAPQVNAAGMTPVKAPQVAFSAGTQPVAASLAGAPREVAYNELTADQLTALGGLGALREAMARRESAQTLAQYAADPSLSVFQRLRANQLENQDLGGTLDALAAEREAAIAQLAGTQRVQTLAADLANQSAVNQGQQFNATQQQAAALANQDAALKAQQINSQVALANQAAQLQAAMANATNAKDVASLQAQLDMTYQQLLGNLTNSQSQMGLQAALFNAGAVNEANQFNVGTALTEAQRQYLADLANAGLTAKDMQTLADIYFGGMGQTTTSTSSSTGTGTSNQGILSGITLSI